MPPSSAKKIMPFAGLAAGAFIAIIILIVLLAAGADLLVRLGLVGGAYFLVLVLAGLCAAAVLFGGLKSYAIYEGKHLGGVIELGGPIVGFALVVCLGFYFGKPDSGGFHATVFVHGKDRTDVVLENTGAVTIAMRNQLRVESIGPKGQAEFKNIPSNFRDQEVDCWVDANGVLREISRVKLTSDGISIKVIADKPRGIAVNSTSSGETNFADESTYTAEEKSIFSLQHQILRIKEEYEQMKTAPDEAKALAADKIEKLGLKLAVDMMAIKDENVAIHRRVNKYTYAALSYYMAAYVIAAPEQRREYSKIAVECTDKSLGFLERLRTEVHGGNPAPIIAYGYKFSLNDEALDRTKYYKAVAMAISAGSGGEFNAGTVKSVWESISTLYRKRFPPNNHYLIEALK